MTLNKKIKDSLFGTDKGVEPDVVEVDNPKNTLDLTNGQAPINTDVKDSKAGYINITGTIATGGGSGRDGKDGKDGAPGKDGSNGKSAYDIAVDNGFKGTELVWLESLKGPVGDSAYQVALQTGFVGSKEAWIASLKGEKGDKGDPGTPGKDGSAGKSAYDIAVDNGYQLDEKNWLLTLRGPQGLKGDPGSPGSTGLQGPKGDKGDTGSQGPVGPQGSTTNSTGANIKAYVNLRDNASKIPTVTDNINVYYMWSNPEWYQWVFAKEWWYVDKAHGIKNMYVTPDNNLSDYFVHVTQKEEYVQLDFYSNNFNDTFANFNAWHIIYKPKTGNWARYVWKDYHVADILAKDTTPTNGKDGASAYDIAVSNGFKGTVDDWLKSLVGPAGKDGKDATSVANTSDSLFIYDASFSDGSQGRGDFGKINLNRIGNVVVASFSLKNDNNLRMNGIRCLMPQGYKPTNINNIINLCDNYSTANYSATLTFNNNSFWNLNFSQNFASKTQLLGTAVWTTNDPAPTT